MKSKCRSFFSPRTWKIQYFDWMWDIGFSKNYWSYKCFRCFAPVIFHFRHDLELFSCQISWLYLFVTRVLLIFCMFLPFNSDERVLLGILKNIYDTCLNTESTITFHELIFNWQHIPWEESQYLVGIYP